MQTIAHLLKCLSNISDTFYNLYFLCKDLLSWFSNNNIHCIVCYIKSCIYTVYTILIQYMLYLFLWHLLFTCCVGRGYKSSQHGPKPTKIIPFKIIRHISRVCSIKRLNFFWYSAITYYYIIYSWRLLSIMYVNRFLIKIVFAKRIYWISTTNIAERSQSGHMLTWAIVI